ncbi:hypothetical protein A9975_09375 [Cupriavidus sp. UME77]|nr:hypothetical protein [Cupriavidus sp. UME77]
MFCLCQKTQLDHAKFFGNAIAARQRGERGIAQERIARAFIYEPRESKASALDCEQRGTVAHGIPERGFRLGRRILVGKDV